MRHALRRIATGGLAAVICGTFAISSALAATPTRTVEDVHISGTFAAGVRCPFEVVRTIDGTFVTTTFTDADGLTKTTFLYRGGKIVYLNPANGRTVQAVLAGPAVYTDNGDGTTTVRIPGNAQLYTAKGVGFVVGNTGILIATIDTVTQEDSVGRLHGRPPGRHTVPGALRRARIGDRTGGGSARIGPPLPFERRRPPARRILLS